jgi:hypothetical protein
MFIKRIKIEMEIRRELAWRRTVCGKIRIVGGCIGAARTSGYDSPHVSQCALETGLFHVERILPMCIIHLESVNK